MYSLFFLRDFGACHFPEYHDGDPVQDAHYEEKRRTHGAQQLPDVVVEDRPAHGPEACRDADYAGYVAYGECLGDHHADRVEPAQAHDGDQAERGDDGRDVPVRRQGVEIGREDAQGRRDGHQRHHAFARAQRIHAPSYHFVRPCRGQYAAHGAEQERDPADPPHLDERQSRILLQVTGQPEETEIPDRVADETDEQHAPQRARLPEPAPREGFAVVPVGGAFAERDVEYLFGRVGVDGHPNDGDQDADGPGQDEDVVPRKDRREPCNDDRGHDRADRPARRTEAVGRGALAFFEPDGHGDDLPGEDRGLGQPQQPAEKCELFHIGRKAASDAGRRPCQDAQKHHLFRAEPVDQDARYGIHDGVAYQEDVDDEGIAVVVHVEGRFDRRLEDRKQLAVEVIADDGDEDRHHDHPFPFFRVVQWRIL